MTFRKADQVCPAEGMGLRGTVPECFGALFDYKVSYRRALELQVRILARRLTGAIPVSSLRICSASGEVACKAAPVLAPCYCFNPKE